MSKAIEVDINLKFVITETGAFPPYEGVCKIDAVGADGQEWKGSIKYDDGRGPEDIIKTICRMDAFKTTIPNLAVAALPEAEEPKAPAPSEEAYDAVRSQLSDQKIGIIRKYISDQNMSITTGGKKKEAVIEEIVAEMKARDGVTVEN